MVDFENPLSLFLWKLLLCAFVEVCVDGEFKSTPNMLGELAFKLFSSAFSLSSEVVCMVSSRFGVVFWFVLVSKGDLTLANVACVASGDIVMDPLWLVSWVLFCV